jgi:hypothetical protein
MRKKLIDKKLKKKVDGACALCGENNYNLLDAHRIIPGKNNGRYTEGNTLSLCVKCHRKVHSGEIELLGKFLSTGGHYVLQFRENGEEGFKSL